jgi:hypothetical protein
MKPGDHPEFFTFPPPEGRSRESTIRLDREGRFFHDGRLVEHAGMAEAFASWVDVHPLDGRFILNNGYDWTYFQVDDVPLFVRALHVAPDAASMELSDGKREPLDLGSLELGSDGAVYCAARAGRMRARFTRSAQLALAPYLSEDEVGRLVIRLAGRSRVLDL